MFINRFKLCFFKWTRYKQTSTQRTIQRTFVFIEKWRNVNCTKPELTAHASKRRFIWRVRSRTVDPTTTSVGEGQWFCKKKTTYFILNQIFEFPSKSANIKINNGWVTEKQYNPGSDTKKHNNECTYVNAESYCH